MGFYIAWMSHGPLEVQIHLSVSVEAWGHYIRHKSTKWERCRGLDNLENIGKETPKWIVFFIRQSYTKCICFHTYSHHQLPTVYFILNKTSSSRMDSHLSYRLCVLAATAAFFCQSVMFVALRNSSRFLCLTDPHISNDRHSSSPAVFKTGP